MHVKNTGPHHKQWNELYGGRIAYICPHIFFLKSLDDSNMTLVKDGLTINLPCDQTTYEYSLGKRIFWLF